MNNDPGSTGDRKLNRRSFLAAFGIGVAAAGLAGCSSAESVTTPTPLAEDPTTAAPETPTAPATETPQGAEPTAESIIEEPPKVNLDRSLFEGWDGKTRAEKIVAAVNYVKANLPEGVDLNDFPDDLLYENPAEAVPEMLVWLGYYIQALSDLALVDNDIAKMVAEGLSEEETYDLRGDVGRRGHFRSALLLSDFTPQFTTGHNLLKVTNHDGGAHSELMYGFLVRGVSGPNKVPVEIVVGWTDQDNVEGKNPEGTGVDKIPAVIRCCSTREDVENPSKPLDIIAGGPLVEIPQQ